MFSYNFSSLIFSAANRKSCDVTRDSASYNNWSQKCSQFLECLRPLSQAFSLLQKTQAMDVNSAADVKELRKTSHE